MQLEKHLNQLASVVVSKVVGVEADALLKPTQDSSRGDFQVNAAMALAKRLKKNPRELGETIAEALRGLPAVETAEVAGPGFVNLRLSQAWIETKMQTLFADPERDGVDPVESPENIVVDFSSPNIAKQMHVGHLRSTVIGDSIVRLLRFTGHNVIGDNHLGDWGTQFGLLIVGMRDFGSEEALTASPIDELERVYKLASAAAKEDEAFADRARAELKKLQSGDADNRAQWQSFVKASKTALNAVYDRLGVTFDEWLGESAYHAQLPGVVEQLLSAGLAREDAGAICVFFDEIAGAPKKLKSQPFIVRKKDGAFLYSTTDIATAFYRKKNFKTDRALYVVDQRQSLHFDQLFLVVEKLGLTMALEHIGFGTVVGADGKPIRSRSGDGKPITLASLLDEAQSRAKERILESDNMRIAAEDLDDVARKVGIGAVKYADLSNNRLTDYQFDFDKMISFSGNSGPYLQYAYARVQNIFRKGDVDPGTLTGKALLNEPQERALGLMLLRFADRVHQAAATRSPHMVGEHLYAIAQAFSSFYAACPVLKSEGAVRESRFLLCALTARQMKRGLDLMGIETVESM